MFLPSDIVVITALLHLSDVNDESPVFCNVPKPYLATVSATAIAGTEIYEVYAKDADQGSQVEYELVSGEFALTLYYFLLLCFNLFYLQCFLFYCSCFHCICFPFVMLLQNCIVIIKISIRVVAISYISLMVKLNI